MYSRFHFGGQSGEGDDAGAAARLAFQTRCGAKSEATQSARPLAPSRWGPAAQEGCRQPSAAKGPRMLASIWSPQAPCLGAGSGRRGDRLVTHFRNDDERRGRGRVTGRHGAQISLSGPDQIVQRTQHRSLCCSVEAPSHKRRPPEPQTTPPRAPYPHPHPTCHMGSCARAPRVSTSCCASVATLACSRNRQPEDSTAPLRGSRRHPRLT